MQRSMTASISGTLAILLAITVAPVGRLLAAGPGPGRPGAADGTPPPPGTGRVVSVLDQGARCDGATDDTAAFAASFAAAAARPGGVVVSLPAGRCVVSATLSLTVGGNTAIRLQGAGRDLSELVWTGNTDGLRVTLASQGFAWLRTPDAASPAFHLDGVSLVSAGPGIGGTALALTSNAASNAASGGGLAPEVELRDIGVHGTVNGAQGWHDGVAMSNLPSGATWTDGYVVLANQAPPWRLVGNGISIRGGPEDAQGCVAMVSSLYFLSGITVMNAGHGVDIGAGVQDVDMDKVGGNGNWFTWAYQRAVCGQTATIRIRDSNQVGYYGSVHVENIDTVFLTGNEPQAAQSPASGYVPYVAFDFVGSIAGNGFPGTIIATGNKILGTAAHGGQRWVGFSLDKAYDVSAGYNPTVISGNTISLMDVPVQAVGQTRSMLLTGNNINNWLGGAPYVFANEGNHAAMNVLNGALEGAGGAAALPGVTASDPHQAGRLYFDRDGFLRRSGG